MRYKAYYLDGFTYSQNEQDSSELSAGKSCFFDVLAYEKDGQNPLVKFEVANGDRTYTVDLNDGHFEINGMPFRMLSDADKNEHISLQNFRLIWFKRVTVCVARQPVQFDINYHLGWQANDNLGNNYKQIMRIL